jgi:hypothetical protein
VYYLHIKSTGVGNPFQAPEWTTTGYVQYGSIGQYTIAGTVPINLDLDGDGLPNEWEFEYFGDVTNAISTVDSDGDGHDNLSERIAGFDPTNSSSVFKIVDFSAPVSNGAPFIITWDPVFGRVYNVGWSDNLQITAFSNLIEDLAHPQSSYTDSVERTGSAHFYHIEVYLAE